MVALGEVVDWLNGYLELGKFPEDQSINGLQVEAGSEVSRVALAVDACAAVFDKAEVDLLLVHHGLYWKGVSPVIAHEMASRVGSLLEKSMSLYAAHLPLDAHPEVGNNPQLLRALGLKPAPAEGMLWKAGFGGSLEELVGKATELAEPKLVLDFGPSSIEEVFVCTGMGTNEIFRLPPGATFITGEFNHYGYHCAIEKRINVVALGHYATETFGVKALGEKLAGEFSLEKEFIDFPTGL